MAKIQNVRGTYDLYGEAKRKPDHKVKSENIVDELVRLVEAKVS